MERHLSTGTATIVALMGAHRPVQNEPKDPDALDRFFRQQVAGIMPVRAGPTMDVPIADSPGGQAPCQERSG